MTAILKELAAASVLGTVLWLALLFFRPLTRRLFSQGWHYYTGLIPAVFLLGASSMILQIAQFMLPKVSPNGNNIATETAITLAAPFNPVNQTFFHTDTIDTIMDTMGQSAAKSRVTLDRMIPYLFAAWVVGCASLLLWKYITYIRFKHRVLQNGKQIRIADCQLPVVISQSIATPMLVGIIKNYIFLPVRQYSERELSLVISHEKAHWKRRDVPVKFILLCANAAHWFNPFVYALIRDSANLCETSCDEALAKKMSLSERLMYGELILSTAEYGINGRSAFIAGMFGGKDLKRRLMYMIKYRKVNLPIRLLSIIVSFALTVGGGVMAYATTGVLGETAENKHDSTEPLYSVQEIDAAIQSAIKSYERNPDELSMDEAAAIATEAFEDFYGLDLNGKTLFLSYQEPLDGRIVMPGEERDPNQAILSPPRWNAIVFYENGDGEGSGWEYRCSMEAVTGRLWNVNRFYKLGDSQYFAFETTQEDLENKKWIDSPSIYSSSEIGATSAFIEDITESTDELLSYIRGDNEYNEMARALVERTNELEDAAVVFCSKLEQLKTAGYIVDGTWINGEWLDDFIIVVNVISSEGVRVNISYKLDTKEFLSAIFEPYIAHFDASTAALNIQPQAQ